RAGRDLAVPGRRGAEREQGGVEALQQHDRHDERRIRPYAESRHTVAAPGGCERRARDRVGRHRRTVDRGGDASRDSGGGPARRMADGELVIEGHGGRDLGVAMSGGRIDVHGDAGENTGGALPGAGRGMTGGEIVIRGSVGDEAGARMRRGLIVVTGDGGRGTGKGMIAGTVVVFGKAGPGTGRFLKRGSIVALGEVERPGTFRYACTYHPLHV